MPAVYQVLLLRPGQGEEAQVTYPTIEEAMRAAGALKASHPKMPVIAMGTGATRAFSDLVHPTLTAGVHYLIQGPR
jgi:hypothetical protein